MKVDRGRLGNYVIILEEAEAFELSQFISNNCRSIRPDGRPALEVRINNEMYGLGLQRLYEEKWAKEYDLD